MKRSVRLVASYFLGLMSLCCLCLGWACTPRLHLQSAGPPQHSEEHERELNRLALQELLARHAVVAGDQTADVAAPLDEDAEGDDTAQNGLPILPVTVLSPQPTPGELGEGIIERNDLERFLDGGPHILMATFALEPVLSDGQFHGFRIDSVNRTVSPLAECGLRTGDIIVAVNGQDIGRPEGFMNVWDSMWEANHIHIDIVRRGQAQSLRWAVQ